MARSGSFSSWVHGSVADSKQIPSGATSDRLFELLREVKALAHEYHDLTGRALGVTGEIAEYEVARHLRVQLAPPRHSCDSSLRAFGLFPEVGRCPERPA